MAPLQTVSMGGVQNKVITWRCQADAIEAGLAHPVQLAHLHVGDEFDEGSRRVKISKLEIVGAELVVFRQVLEGWGATSANA
jgi:hypothetical protein